MHYPSSLATLPDLCHGPAVRQGRQGVYNCRGASPDRTPRSPEASRASRSATIAASCTLTRVRVRVRVGVVVAVGVGVGVGVGLGLALALIEAHQEAAAQREHGARRADGKDHP